MHRLSGHQGIYVVTALCIFPVIPWLLMSPLASRFGSGVSTLHSIGQLSGLIGFAMFSVALILIARLKTLEPLFGGLDRVFHAHRHLGALGFLLMLVHPLALAATYIPSSTTAALQFLTPSMSDLPRSLGIGALLLFMTLITATLFAHWRYQVLLSTHRVLGIAFLLGGIHAFLIPSDLSSNSVLSGYMLMLSLFALAAYLYRTVFARAAPKHRFTVARVQPLADDVVEITLSPEGAPMQFEPGQFVFVSFKDPSIGTEVHPFSISSAPHEKNLRLTIKALGDYTAMLPKLGEGVAVDVEGPFGGFTEACARTTKEVWVAGGIGITPFLSRARALAAQGENHRILHLYYSVRTRNELLFLRELSDLAKRIPGFAVIPHVSEEAGFLTARALEESTGPLKDKDVFVCGPKAMMDSVIGQCKALGVHPSQIHAEEFRML